jgi:hypothetical protein
MKTLRKNTQRMDQNEYITKYFLCLAFFIEHSTYNRLFNGMI